MMEERLVIQGTQTQRNLDDALTSEALSVVKYLLFAEESCFEVIKEKFNYVAKQELEHAEVFLRFLGGLGDDTDNLRNSVALEGFVSAIDYPDAARTAEEEGFPDIAQAFRDISTIEQRHKKTFQAYLDDVECDTLLKRPTKQNWMCLECGFIVEGLEAPEDCPVCEHDRSYFKIYEEGD